ncbi:hypothetical protein SELMODRAFT_440724 [Selaginella moellendorffii]|uniref:Tify domain-containing protein n=1 Tax=Selaginella moellendorffii TaxID=88036 RepID=D8RDX8_SELML|nr:hypothetical protein SELMODRAFT_440724 [Selaginella moellendorffii]
MGEEEGIGKALAPAQGRITLLQYRDWKQRKGLARAASQSRERSASAGVPGNAVARAQALLSDDAEVEPRRTGTGTGKSSSPGLIKKIKLKISSNGRYGTRSESLRERQAAAKREGLKIVLKRKAPEAQEALVIKKHKRGIHRQQRLHGEEKRDEEEEDEEEEQERSTPAPETKAPPSAVKSKASPATENASPSREETNNTGGVLEEATAVKEEVAGSAGRFCCTVNTDMVADRSEASVSSEPSCSADSKSSKKRHADEERAMDGQTLVAVTATRTPLFVPAKRSPLPFPLPAAVPPVITATPTAAPPAVRSALPAPPAVRSALPLPGGDETVVFDEVDIHGFSSAITGSEVLRLRHDGLVAQSSEEDGLSLPEEEMLSPMFFGNPWHDDGSMSCLPEMRKKGGPGSRAIYRCSRCLAPKKGHRCPFETESPVEDAKPEQVPRHGSHKKASDTSTSNELECQNTDRASPSKSNDTPPAETSIQEEETSKPGKSKAAAPPPPDPVVKEFTVSAKWLLESGVLEGLTVRYMPRPGEVLGSGVVKSGVILCNCRHCKSHQGFNASSFEKHVGSTARHPSDFIFLDNGRRLREVLEDGSRFRDKPNMMGALRKAVSMDWEDDS